MPGTARSLGRVWRAAAVAAAVTATVLTAPAGAREVKLAHLAPTNDPRHESLVEFARMVEEGTNGAIKVKIFPKSQLGKDREVFEQLQAGLTELALNGEIISNFFPKWSVINMPYLWRDQDHLRRFLSSDIARQWIQETADATGVQVLGFFERNPRILTTRDAPVKSVDDIQGLKVRVPKINVYMDTWRAFGVQPTPMSAAEFFSALKLGTVDGMENPIEVMYHWKIYEVSNHLSFTNHMLTRLFLTASRKFLDGLPEDHRQVIVKAGEEASRLHAAKMEQMIPELTAKLKEKGMNIIESPDTSGFEARAEKVHEKYRDLVGPQTFDAIKSM